MLDSFDTVHPFSSEVRALSASYVNVSTKLPIRAYERPCDIRRALRLGEPLSFRLLTGAHIFLAKSRPGGLRSEKISQAL